jgi:GAF domain-containing protein
VFARRPGVDILDLVAQAGMSQEWQQAVAAGLPLDGHFLATDTFNSKEIRNYVDISKLNRRYGPTVRLMRAAQLPAQLSVPLVDHNGAWGQLGFGRRSDSPFTTPQCMVLEATGAVLGALFADEPLDSTTTAGRG